MTADSVHSMDQAHSVDDSIIAFIVRDLEWDGDVATLLADPPALLPEALDSQDLLELSGFIEYEFGIEIFDEEINADNMGTLPALFSFVRQKIARRLSD
jgi:acyl carrier protein